MPGIGHWAERRNEQMGLEPRFSHAQVNPGSAIDEKPGN
jgi:hypothetical protein